MLTPEGREKAEIRRYLNSIGAYHVVTHMTGFGAGGTPDIIACIAGLMWGIEVKREGRSPTPRQLMRIQDIQKAGGQATWGTAAKVINDIKEWANGAETPTRRRQPSS